MYKISIFLESGLPFSKVEKYVEERDDVDPFLNDSVREGGIWVKNTDTGISHIIHNRRFLYIEVEDIGSQEPPTSNLIVEAVS